MRYASWPTFWCAGNLYCCWLQQTWIYLLICSNRQQCDVLLPDSFNVQHCNIGATQRQCDAKMFDYEVGFGIFFLTSHQDFRIIFWDKITKTVVNLEQWWFFTPSTKRLNTQTHTHLRRITDFCVFMKTVGREEVNQLSFYHPTHFSKVFVNLIVSVVVTCHFDSHCPTCQFMPQSQ